MKTAAAEKATPRKGHGKSTLLVDPEIHRIVKAAAGLEGVGLYEFANAVLGDYARKVLATVEDDGKEG